MLETSFVRTEGEFHSLRREWNDLLGQSVSDVPFLRHEYLAAWWDTLGGGEWPQGKLCVVVGRDGGGRLVGAAPLFRTDLGTDPVLRWVGSREVSDYLDLVVGRGELQGFAEAVMQALEGERWTAMELDNLLDSSPSILALEAAARGQGWSVSRQRQKPAPVVSLDGGWDAYLARLEKKHRHELRRKMRRAEAHPGGVRVRHVRNGPDLAMEVDLFLGLMAYDQGKAEFLTSRMRQHFYRVASAAAQGGYLDLVFLDVDGHPAAGYFNFDYRNRIWVYNSGLDPAFVSLSPGWVLMGLLIEQAAADGKEAVDLLQGEEPYKAQLGGLPRHVHRLTITRGGR